MMSERPKVVLVNPPSPPGATANREGAAGMGVLLPQEGGFFYPPQTVAYAASVLREEGFEVKAADAVGEGLAQEATLAFLAEEKPQAVGVFVSWATLEGDLAFVRALRRTLPQARILAFGPALRFGGDEALHRSPLDAVVVGEPELLLPAAFRLLTEAPPPKRLLGPQELGAPGYDQAGFIADLDSLPRPAWELLPYRRYRLLSLFASRGCPHHCTYCPYVLAQGRRFRPRSPEAVIEEMGWLMRAFNPPRVVFRDPAFALQRERVVRLCELMLSKGLKANWECESRPEHFDAELLRLMRRAGCQAIKIGLETAEPRLLVEWRRLGSEEEARDYLRRIEELVRLSSSLGMLCRLFVMVGLPGQTEETIVRTRDYLARIRPRVLHVQRFRAYPGLELETQGLEEESLSRQEAMLLATVSRADGGQTVWRKLKGKLRERLRPLALYHVGDEIRFRWFRRVLGEVLTSPPRDVLDAGSGAGHYAFFVARRFPKARVRGVDVNEEAIALCRKRQEAEGPDNLEFLLRDITEPLGEELYDFIYAIDVLEHIEDDEALLANFHRALKPDGVLLIHTPLEVVGQRHFLRRFAHYHVAGHVRDGYAESDLLKKMRGANLEVFFKLYTHGPWGTLAWDLWMLCREKLWARLLLRPLAALLVRLETTGRNRWGNCLLLAAVKR